MDPRSGLSALSVAAAISATITIAARYTSPQRHVLSYVFKPLTTGLILAVALISATRAWSVYAVALVLGLLFSLAGDIWLVLPADRFLHGLASFMLAQLSYCVAFAAVTRYSAFPWSAVPLILFGGLALLYLWPGLTPRLRAPVAAYVLVIVAMAGLAVYRAATLPAVGAVLAAVGALLFLTSDAALAVNRFRRPFASAHGVVLGTYFAGQLLIALSVGI